MKFHYYPETDSLYIEFLEDKTSVDSKEIAPNIVLDFDKDGNLIGIDIDNASRLIDLSRVEINSLPIENLLLSKS
ncbi:DUF2283 domain-containing protein [bacterium]|nr:DUF2283 domain-containing protein [bacterium]